MGCASLLLACLSLTLPDTLHYTLTFSLNELAFDSIGGEDFVTLRGCQPILKEGSPSLPRFPAVFVIPAGSRVGDCWGTVEQSSSINGTFSIWPAQPPIPISWTDTIPTIPPDSAIYNSNSAWPSTICQAADVGAVDGTYFARVDVFPLTWNPSSGALSLRTEIDISLEVIEDSIPAPDPVLMTDYFWDRRIERLSALVLNPDDLEDFSVVPDIVPENDRGEGSAPIAVDCLILTPEDWASSWQTLIDWNNQRGLYTEVLSLEEIDEFADSIWLEGRDWAETIRNCIRCEHENRGVQYIILGTDFTTAEPYPTHLEIPARIAKGWGFWPVNPPEAYWIPTDWYYSCLSSVYNWDTNENEIWGEYFPPSGNELEGDLMDLLPDVAVGRLTSHSATEVADISSRLVAYQRREPSQVAPGLDILVISASVWDTSSAVPPTWQHMQAILEPVPPAISSQWLAEWYCGVQSLPLTPTRLLGWLSANAGHEEEGGAWRVEFGGHGDHTYIAANNWGTLPGDSVIHSEDLRELIGAGGQFSTAWAFNCLTARFCDVVPDETIGEAWIGLDGEQSNAPLGPCFMGNTDIGLNYYVAGGSTSHRLNTMFLNHLYNDIPDVGALGSADLFCAAKVDYSSEFLSGYPGTVPDPIEYAPDEWIEPMWDMKVANLLGDPACPLWIGETQSLSVAHPSVLRCPNQLTVTVTGSGSLPIPGARVCLLMLSNGHFEIYKRGCTDSSGEFSAYLDPSVAGSLLITVTRRDHLPYQGTCALRI